MASVTQFCTQCGSPRVVATDGFCRSCGTVLRAPTSRPRAEVPRAQTDGKLSSAEGISGYRVGLWLTATIWVTFLNRIVHGDANSWWMYLIYAGLLVTFIQWVIFRIEPRAGKEFTVLLSVFWFVWIIWLVYRLIRGRIGYTRRRASKDA